MSNKEKFINMIQKEIFDRPDIWIEEYEEDWEDIFNFWSILKNIEEKEKPLFTDNGKLILNYLKNNDTLKSWRAKDIAEGLSISSRTVSGSLRKLANDGFVEKIGKDPVIYILTNKGKNIIID